MPPRLLDGPETPQEHIRNALAMLDAVERAFREFGLVLTGDQLIDFYGPLAAARGRLWSAVSQLEEQNGDMP